MRLALVTEAHAAAVRAALGENDTVRVVQPGDGPGALAEAARAPLDALVLDVATGPGLGPAVVGYRIARPGARVVILAAGRSAGDPDVGALVAAGVYDVCGDPADLADLLARPAGTLVDAVSWLPRGLSPGAAAPKVVTRTVVQRHVVERERLVTAPMASHPAVVAVVGLCGGCGATVAVAALAGWLTRQRQDVILLGRGPVLRAWAAGVEMPEGTWALADGLLALRPALAAPADDLPLPDLVAWALGERRWPWIIVDAGRVGEAADGQGGATWGWPEAAGGADVTILVVPPEAARLLEHATRWGAHHRAQALAPGVRVAVRWHPRDGREGLRAPLRRLLGDWWQGETALPVPDMTGAIAAGWPVSGLAADPRLDRAARALLAPLADHLAAGTGSGRGR